MLVHFAFICLGQDLIMYVFDYCFNSVRLLFFNQGILLYTHFLYEEDIICLYCGINKKSESPSRNPRPSDSDCTLILYH